MRLRDCPLSPLSFVSATDFRSLAMGTSLAVHVLDVAPGASRIRFQTWRWSSYEVRNAKKLVRFVLRDGVVSQIFQFQVAVTNDRVHALLEPGACGR